MKKGSGEESWLSRGSDKSVFQRPWRDRVVFKDIQKKDYHKLEGYKEGQGVTKTD